MATWQDGYIETPDVRLHYTRTAAVTSLAKPSLVLAHGVTDDGLCWSPVAEALQDEFDLIMVDARGHGLSSAPESGYGPAEQAEDLHALIAELGLVRPAILGHSMGAATTLVLAGTHPVVPGKILLEDPPPWWMPTETEPKPSEELIAQMRAWMTGLKDKSRDDLIADQRAETPGWSEAELGPWADSKLRVSPNVVAVFNGASAPVDWATLLTRISCPALLITGDPEQGAIVHDEHASNLKTLIPQLQVAHIPQSGHNIRRDQFDRYLNVIRAFLAE